MVSQDEPIKLKFGDINDDDDDDDRDRLDIGKSTQSRPETSTWDGYKKFNNIPVQPNVQVVMDHISGTVFLYPFSDHESESFPEINKELHVVVPSVHTTIKTAIKDITENMVSLRASLKKMT